jgi:hypothetical protein
MGHYLCFKYARTHSCTSHFISFVSFLTDVVRLNMLVSVPSMFRRLRFSWHSLLCTLIRAHAAHPGRTFSLFRVATVDPDIRVRFTSPHPKDFDDETLSVIAAHPNICRHLHMPAQSGSTAVLERMRRGYTREAYDALLERARSIVPGVTFSTDIIVGFCGETEDDYEATLDLLRREKFSSGFLFMYSDRERTHAARKYVDDVPPEVKSRRLSEALDVFKEGVSHHRRQLVGTRQLVSTPPHCDVRVAYK